MSGFKLFSFRGIPVYFSIWFMVLVAYVATKVPGVMYGLMMIVAILASLLVHEFGHALMARAFRLQPSVLLHGWGGLCTHASPRSARDDAYIIAAGPAAGLIFGGLVFAVTLLLDAVLSPGWQGSVPYLSYLFDVLIDWNIYWSLINLLPVYPLDGGQLFQLWAHKRFPAMQAHTYTHYLGIGIAVAGVVWASSNKNTLLLVIAAFIIIENIQRLQMGPRRDYNERTSAAPVIQHGAGFLGRLKPEPLIAKLMLAMGVIWAFFVIAGPVLEAAWSTAAGDELALHPLEAVAGLHIWQLGTYMWLHDVGSLSHIVTNTFGLWLLGNVLVRRWGAKDFLNFYLWSGLGAGVFSVIVGHLFPETFGSPIVGASGALMGMLTAFSMTMREQVLGQFFSVTVRAKHVLPVFVALDLLSFISGRADGVAIQTHMGGVLMGWLLLTGNWRPALAMDRFRLWRIRSGKRQPASKRAPHLRVIDGGKKDGDESSENKRDDDEWLH